MQHKTIKRTDSCYLEIENFKDYEFTNNISYEMAVRNDTVKSLLEELSFLDKQNAIRTKEEFIESLLNGTYTNTITPRQNEIIQILSKDYFISSQKEFTDPDFSKTILYPTYKVFALLPPDEDLNYDDAWIISDTVATAASLIPNFSRPFMIPPQDKDKRLPFFLNLGLPINDLISLITEIKKNYDLKHTNIMTLAEALGDDFEKSDTNVNLVTSRNFDSMEVLKFKMKVADMLYAYDAHQSGIKKQEYTMEIYNYHLSKYENTKVTFSDNTRYKYFDVAQEYIGNLRYKELITGIKY